MSGPRILIVNTDYPAFLEWFYASDPRLGGACYDDQVRARAATLFGVADFYSRHFRTSGWDAIDVHANNAVMQSAWAAEHGVAAAETSLTHSFAGAARSARQLAARTPLRHLKRFVRPALDAIERSDVDARWDILLAQIEAFRPDVIFNTAVGVVPSRLLRRMKPAVRLLAGQIASPLPPDDDLAGYDLLISSLPNLVEYFRGLGIPSELNRFAFEPSILPQITANGLRVDVSFVGSVTAFHGTRTRLLEAVAQQCDLHTWGSIDADVPEDAQVRRHNHPPLWGAAMYRVLAGSRITLNCHIDLAGPYANNMRLFEATGSGALLVTDAKANLGEMFDPGSEVVAYRSAGECVELVRHFLSHEDERRAIAARGQARTLSQHTYEARTAELASMFEARL